MIDVGSTLGPYKLLSLLGSGGMGEVYKALDSRLDRVVAVKVLNPQTSTAEYSKRFEREARIISGLSHPNICSVYDFGQDDGTQYLVMEYLEGKTLAQVVASGAPTTDAALRYAIQILHALRAAHRKGIVHRDLKPGNVMLTKDGLKLLDFGLAKHQSPWNAVQSLDNHATTVPNALTAKGTILGTLHYMSPEQLNGADVDVRSDIFSFGVVLYELLTGKRPFVGTSAASISAAILEREPPPIVDDSIPEELKGAVRRALLKDPAERWQSAHDLLVNLEEISSATHPRRAPADARSHGTIAWIAAATFGITALGALLFTTIRSTREMPRSRFALAIGAVPSISFAFDRGPMAVSPDSRYLAHPAGTPDGKKPLAIRDLSSGETLLVPDSEGASFPFWSPDNREVAYFSDGRLQRYTLSSRAVSTICVAQEGRGGSWNRKGTIIFAAGLRDGISRVPATGGEPSGVTIPRKSLGETTHRYPAFLSDDDHFLYLGRGDDASALTPVVGVYIGSLANGQPRQLLNVASNPVVVGDEILYWHDRALRSQRIQDNLRLDPKVRVIASDVHYIPTASLAMVTVSEQAIVYETLAASATQLRWTDRNGIPAGFIGPPGQYWAPDLTADGRRVAIDLSDPGTATGDVWVYDTSRGTGMRVTSNEANESAPVWLGRSDELIFRSSKTGSSDLYLKRLSGPGAEQVAFSDSRYKIPTSASTDGRYVIFTSRSGKDQKSRDDIWILDRSTGEARPFIETPFNESAGAISPDSRIFAYISDETGRNEVYVEAFPGRGNRTIVSTSGGGMPRWRADGRELFYVTPDRDLMSVSVTASPEPHVTIPQKLFRLPIRFSAGDSAEYAVAPDGTRFLVNTFEIQNELPVASVINWRTTEAVTTP